MIEQAKFNYPRLGKALGKKQLKAKEKDNQKPLKNIQNKYYDSDNNYRFVLKQKYIYMTSLMLKGKVN